jgi:ribosome-associated toxin RatA of RatAB toxin-antitoxin module
MRRIISNDKYLYKHDPEKIFDAISDFRFYSQWWGKKVHVKLIQVTENKIGSRVEVHASRGWFRCELVSLLPFEEVRIKYYEGVQSGEGIWKINRLEDGKCELIYSIDLEPKGLLPRFLSNYINFSKIHSKAMLGLFEGLEKYLLTK